MSRMRSQSSTTPLPRYPCLEPRHLAPRSQVPTQHSHPETPPYDRRLNQPSFVPAR
ncbi:hypothetical protein T484DRAFT_1944379 [Baffinella frigidus]|nr:hypothetical protein T484DRAFT_1944379 [Cryptophyta sp. CCMP2293]